MSHEKSTDQTKEDKDKRPKRSATDFTQLPNQVMRDPRLTQSDKVVYWVLKSHAWNGKDTSFPSARRIADECGVSPRHVSVRTRRLEECGYIKVKRKLGDVNHYQFPSTLPPEVEKVPPPQNVKGYLNQREGYLEDREGYHQKVRTKHTKRNILTKTDEGNHIHKNHTKYDSYGQIQEILPSGSDPKEGSESTSPLFTEGGQLLTSLQDTVGVVSSGSDGETTGVGQTGRSAQESPAPRPVPDWLEIELNHLLKPNDPIRARAVEHFTDRFKVMQMTMMSPNAKREAVEGFVEVEQLADRANQKFVRNESNAV